MEVGALITLDRMPTGVREALEHVEAAQREGAETEGSADDLTRRYELEEEGIVYLPELARPVSRTGLAFLVVGVAGAAAVIAGLSLIAEDVDWAPALVGVGGVLIWLAMRLARRDTIATAARRDGVERLGVHLSPSALVLHEEDGLRVFPRDRIVHFELRSASDQHTTIHLNLVYRDDAGASQAFHLETGTKARLEPVFRILERWFGDAASARAG